LINILLLILLQNITRDENLEADLIDSK